MKPETVAVILGIMVLLGLASASPYFVDGDYGVGEYGDNNKLSNSLFAMDKRLSCIRRGHSCDHRPSDCCFSSACRCNLWGTNCRCTRAGLFQRWGRK